MSSEGFFGLREWDNLTGFCQEWAACAQSFRPISDFTGRSVSVPLCRWDNLRRGKGIIGIEEVTDPKLPGRRIYQWEWHSDELGDPGDPQWISRGFGIKTFKAGEQYRIVIHSLPGWEIFDEETGLWKIWETGAAIQWASMKAGDVFPNGEMQIGYNYRDHSGRWRIVKNSDFSFVIGAQAIEQYILSIQVSPPEAGRVEALPAKGSYIPGEEVSIRAIPEQGYEFEEWIGDLTGSDATIRIIMDSNKFAIAQFTGSEIPHVPIIEDIIKWIKAALAELRDWITAQLDALLDQIEGIFRPILETVLAPLKTALFWVQEQILEIVDWITAKIPEMLAWIEEKVGEIWEWVTDTIPEALNWMRARIDELWEWFRTELPAIIGSIREVLEGVWEWLKTEIPQKFQEIMDQISGVIEWLTGLKEEIFKFFEEKLAEVWAILNLIKDDLIEFFKDPLGWVIANIFEPMVSSFVDGFEQALKEEEGEFQPA